MNRACYKANKVIIHRCATNLYYVITNYIEKGKLK